MQLTHLLGLDVDETLVIGPGRTFTKFLPLFGIKFNQALYEKTHSWEAATGVTKEQLTPLYEAFMESEWCPVSQPIPGAREFLTALRQFAPIILITARGLRTEPKTLKELDHHFGSIFDRSYFGCLGSKAQIMAEQGIAILIDDSDNEAERVVAALDHAYVIKFPHYLFDVNGVSSSRAHPRIIQLAARRHLKPGMPEAERGAVLATAWNEARQRVLELATENWPHLLENDSTLEACQQ